KRRASGGVAKDAVDDRPRATAYLEAPCVKRRREQHVPSHIEQVAVCRVGGHPSTADKSLPLAGVQPYGFDGGIVVRLRTREGAHVKQYGLAAGQQRRETVRSFMLLRIERRHTMRLTTRCRH